MNFESIEEIFDRIEDVINEVREDSRYVESLDVLMDLSANKKIAYL